MRGRKPIPTQLKELHGNPGKTALPKAEPKPVGDLTEPPEWLSAQQKAGWAYALLNAPPSLLRRIDRGALVVWVVAEDLHRQAVTKQNETGALIVRASANGGTMQSPYLPVINRQGLIMMKAASELGFTPVSRPRVFGGAPPPSAPRHGADAGDGEAEVALDDYLASPPPRVIN
jgi:P27 family predicted phage terminase small subunit